MAGEIGTFDSIDVWAAHPRLRTRRFPYVRPRLVSADTSDIPTVPSRFEVAAPVDTLQTNTRQEAAARYAPIREDKA